MALSITTTAVSKKLVSTTMARTRLGTESTNDTELGQLIDDVSAFFDLQTGRTLAYQVYSETVPGFGEPWLRLSNAPILSTTVTVTYQAPGSTEASTISTALYVVDAEAGMLVATTGWHWTASAKGDLVRDEWPGSEHPSYTVVYGAGFAMPSTSTGTGTKLPLDLRLAALKTVQDWWADLGLERSSTTFEAIRTDDFEVRTHEKQGKGAAVGELSDGVAATLARYRLEL